MEVEELAVRLDALADDIADLALDRLRTATSAVRDGKKPDLAIVAEEKRLTRARRSVEKAAAVLRSRPDN
jgi:hypothetical protein